MEMRQARSRADASPFPELIPVILGQRLLR